MEVTLQSINQVMSATNFIVSKLIAPGATTLVLAETVVITQIGTTAIATTNQTSQVELYDTGYTYAYLSKFNYLYTSII